MATGTPIIMYSGCRWTDAGGAQRPVAITRELQRRGVEALYCSSWDPLPYVPSRPGVAIIAWPNHFQTARRLIDSGWRVIYDYIDDWGGFLKSGDLPSDRGLFDHEWELVEAAELVVGSAPQLVERALSWGVRAELVENAGPNAFVPKTVNPDRDFADPFVSVYAGYLFGTWLQWECLEALSTLQDNTTLLVGEFCTKGWSGADIDVCVDHRLPRTRWLGRLDHANCLGVIGASDVGLIPFTQELSHFVDPIKYYDYLSRGLWTVSTPDVWPLHDKPNVIMASPELFPMAAMEAADRTHKDPPDPAYHYANTWEKRVDRLLELVEQVMSRHRPGRNGKVKKGSVDPGKLYPFPLPRPAVLSRDKKPRRPAVEEEDVKLRVSVQIPGGECSMVSQGLGQCPYCSEAPHAEGLPPIQGTVGEWVNGLLAIGDKWGPCYFNFCFGEPLASEECVRIIGAVARKHRVDVVTNALAQPSVLEKWPRNGNIGISTSWHPHAWNSVTDFMVRREQYERAGFYVGTVGVVAWPPYLAKLHEWDEEFHRLGVEDMCVGPFWGKWRGMEFPAAYSPGEQELLRLYSERSYLGEQPMRTWDNPMGMRCAAGRDYVFITHSGDVQRCSMVCEPPLGNLLEGSVELLESATRCPSGSCPCPDLWHLIEDDKQEIVLGRRTQPSMVELEKGAMRVEMYWSDRQRRSRHDVTEPEHELEVV